MVVFLQFINNTSKIRSNIEASGLLLLEYVHRKPPYNQRNYFKFVHSFHQ